MRLGSKAYLLLVYTVGAVVVTVRAVPAGDDAVIAGGRTRLTGQDNSVLRCQNWS